MPYKNRVAVLGAGLTRFMRRALETPKELAFEAAKTALEDAGLTIDDIDCVVSVTAPEAFDGVAVPVGDGVVRGGVLSF